MIQDIQPYHLDNHFDPAIKPSDDSNVIVILDGDAGKELLINVDDTKKEISFPKVVDIKNRLEGYEIDSVLVYMFSIGEEKFFLLMPKEADEAYADEYVSKSEMEKEQNNDAKSFSFRTMISFRKEYLNPQYYVFAAYTAYQLHEWYRVTKFCGKCGALNENHSKERARICPKCGNIIYPRINPAAIIAVTDRETDRIVLTKYRTGFAHNALVAGFTEIGETLEETVKREVMEEIGLEVTNIRYYKSQPWGIASDILTGFFCDVTGSKEIKMDSSELKYAKWVSRENIELQPLDYSLTNEMMRLFKEKGYNATISR